jgi:4-amino-4-deoxy-L-arabinose transferase-like glycosyltransferase
MKTTISTLYWAAGWVALFLCVIIAYHFRYEFDKPELGYAVPLLPVALVLCVLVFRWRGAVEYLQERSSTLTLDPMMGWSQRRSRRAVLFFGLLALLILALVNMRWLPLVNMHIQFGLLLFGAVSLSWGLGGGGSRQVIQRRWDGHRLALVAVLLLAFAMRLYALEETVPHMVDEGLFADRVTEALTIQALKPLLLPFDGLAAFPWLYPYLQWMTVEVVGRNLTGLRLVSVVIGTLTVAAVYLLGRQILDRPTALLGALLLAALPPHVVFSRLALNNIADPLFGTLAVAFLLRGWRRGEPLNYALAGTLLGFTQYFYEAGRLVFPVLVSGAIVWFGWQERRTVWALLKQHTPMLLAALALALPVYLTLIANELPLTPRAAHIGMELNDWVEKLAADDWEGVARHLLNPWLVFVYQPEDIPYYGGGQPMLLPWLVPFFLLGLFSLLAHWRRPAVLLLFWLLLVILGNTLVINNLNYTRYVTVFPPMALVLAIGVRTALEWLIPAHRPGERLRPARLHLPLMIADLNIELTLRSLSRVVTQRYIQRLMGVLGILAAILHSGYLLGPYQAAYRFEVYHNRFDWEGAIRRSLPYPAAWPILIATDYDDPAYVQGVLNYYTDGRLLTIQRPRAFTAAFLETLPDNQGLLVFLPPDDLSLAERLGGEYTLHGPYFGPDNVPFEYQLWLYVALPPGIAMPG